MFFALTNCSVTAPSNNFPYRKKTSTGAPIYREYKRLEKTRAVTGEMKFIKIHECKSCTLGLRLFHLQFILSQAESNILFLNDRNITDFVQ